MSIHSLALLADGSVMAWGRGNEGELGNGAMAGSDVPVSVELGGAAVTAISGGEEHNLALLGDGTVMAWGANGQGQLGDGGTAASPVPVAVTGLTGVSAIAAGGHNSLAARASSPPVLTSVSASSGPAAGGTQITIAGANLMQASAVHFGSWSAAFTVDSPTSISAVSPPGTGSVAVTVTTPYGTSVPKPHGRFRFLAGQPCRDTGRRTCRGRTRAQAGAALASRASDSSAASSAEMFAPITSMSGSASKSPSSPKLSCPL